MNDVDFNTSYSAVGDGVVAGEWTFAADKDKMYEYFVDNPNTTQHAIIFTSAYVYHASDEVPLKWATCSSTTPLSRTRTPWS